MTVSVWACVWLTLVLSASSVCLLSLQGLVFVSLPVWYLCVWMCVCPCMCVCCVWVHACLSACVCVFVCVWVCLESDIGFFLNCSHLIHWGRVSQLNPSFQCLYHSCCGILCLCLPTDGSRAWESMGPVMYCVVFPGVMRDALDIQHDPEPWRSSASFHRWRNWGTGKFSNLRIQVTDQLSSEPTSEHLFI
jgi:hypothetical protein